MERYWRELPPDVDMFAYASNFVGATLLPDDEANKKKQELEKAKTIPSITDIPKIS